METTDEVHAEEKSAPGIKERKKQEKEYI